MNILTYFDSVCATSSPDTVFWPYSISNTPGGTTKALPDPDVLSPNFLFHFSFNLNFDLVINSALDSFLFFHKKFFTSLP